MSEICPKCGLPKELCVCEDIAKEDVSIVVKKEKRRFGKVYTVITGLNSKDVNLKAITKVLKTKLACGGTFSEDKIELQGDHKKKVKDILVEQGFSPESINIQ